MAKIFNFTRNIEFNTDICEQCEKECDEKSCLPLEMFRQLSLVKNPGVQIEMLMSIADMFNSEEGSSIGD